VGSPGVGLLSARKHLGILLPGQGECLTFGTPVEKRKRKRTGKRGAIRGEFRASLRLPYAAANCVRDCATFLKVMRQTCARFGIVVSRDAEPRVARGM